MGCQNYLNNKDSIDDLYRGSAPGPVLYDPSHIGRINYLFDIDRIDDPYHTRASLALVPLIGLLLNYTPWGIRLTPITLSAHAQRGFFTQRHLLDILKAYGIYFI